MKRLTALLLALLLMISGALAEEEALISVAIELGIALDELASDTAYVQLKTDDESVLVLIQEFANGNHDMPMQIIQVDLSQMLLDEDPFFVEFGITDEEVKRGWRIYRACSLLHHINRFYGETQNKGANILWTIEAKPELTVSDIGMYVLLYDDAAPVGVVWWPEDEGAHFKAEMLPAKNILDGFMVPLTVVFDSNQDMDERSIAQ